MSSFLRIQRQEPPVSMAAKTGRVVETAIDMEEGESGSGAGADSFSKTGGSDSERTDGLQSYLDRLLKMIPAEVISLYLVGSGVIPEDSNRSLVLTIWAVICLIGVVSFRAWGTRDSDNNLPPDWKHVSISTVAFIIWVYTIGGPFKEFNIYIPYVGSLLVLAWTFFIPIFYKGPKDVRYA